LVFSQTYTRPDNIGKYDANFRRFYEPAKMHMKFNKLFVYAALVSLLAFPRNTSADDLYKISVGNKNTVGEILSRSDEEIKIKDLQDGRTLTFAVGEISSLEKADNEGYNIRYAGIPRYLAWRISDHSSMKTPRGKIAANDSGVFYASVGEDSGAQKGQVFSVFSSGKDIKDPDTGKVIGTARRKLAELKLTQLEKQMSKLTRVDGLENELAVGSEIVGSPKKLAIIPLTNEQGRETSESRRIAEQILTRLVERDVNVVERRLLEKVVNEIGLQQQTAFDDATAVRVGKLLGADRILTGTTSLLNNGQTRYFCRLIDVQTSKVLVGVTHAEKDSAMSARGTATPNEPKPGRSKAGKGDSDFVSLFNGKDLQGWNVDARFWRVADGMILGKKTPRSGGDSYAATTEKFDDFILKLKFKVNSGDSGIQFGGELLPGFRMSGNHLNLSYENNLSELAWLYVNQEKVSWPTPQLQAGIKKSLNPQGWNDCVIAADASQIRVEINGIVVANWRQRDRMKGSIGFQLHNSGADVAFKDIFIKIIK
jgi:hypothetical protein